ncbi:UDP-N-acetyl-D-glucosamine 6-dehydrogenase [Nocardioides dokdonensis FR1436]|uniref:UDP-N-acetyl-D-glucosamine 6-dehydrogenase n=1 Tax=Nocardioides dokdonensis FR1436 TaxID=1300347 RepID=A0A1A9GIR8_9ACTN|nr:nucleotide sugar dehydrogenase [Nocardioides dokdonensis]ANH38199.1 UDP-N-acetyl-D-glucosamine 6-dehydrogenase [Nocardioides dokdonensis FR1436]
MKIAVIGLGKIGLPLAAQFANKGHTVVGVDIAPSTVATINEAVAPFPGEAQLGEYLTRLVPAGKLRATTNYADAIPEADAVVVVVPLFVDNDGRPDFGWMDKATADLAANLTKDTLVAYETTLPVGTLRTRWKPQLEHGSGLIEGTDFHVVFSPERVLTGRVFEDLRKYPKLLGGLSSEGAKRAVAFYEQVLDFDERPDLERGNGVWDLGSAEAAEMAKLAETTYRDVNIGLANQFAKFAETAGIDVYQVIEASNSQPYSHIHRPGISVGGHCIPVYPRLYLSNDPDATIVRAAREANTQMPAHAIARLQVEYGDLTGARVVVLGAAYRAGVKETAFSGVFDLVRHLGEVGAIASVHDPLYTQPELTGLGLTPHTFGESVDAAVLHTDHPEYRLLTRDDLPNVRQIIDGRAAIAAGKFECPVHVIGTP